MESLRRNYKEGNYSLSRENVAKLCSQANGGIVSNRLTQNFSSLAKFNDFTNCVLKHLSAQLLGKDTHCASAF